MQEQRPMWIPKQNGNQEQLRLGLPVPVQRVLVKRKLLIERTETEQIEVLLQPQEVEAKKM